MDNIVDISLGSINLYDLLTGVIAIIFAALMAFVTTPVSRVIAYKIGAVDNPKKDDRRMHDEPMPRLGGLAIFFSFVFSVLLFYKVSNSTLAMIAGAFILIITGILDDVFTLRPLYKFLAQVAAAGIVVWQGLVIGHINIFGQYIEFGYLSIPITMIWIVGLINAINLIDGLDGLACGISTISAVALLVVTILIGEFEVALLIAILAGSCLGFLPFNTSPAKIIMGDTGATFLGFILAIVSIQGVFKVHAVITFVIPFLILGVPIFDTLFAMIRRILSGRHPFSADRGHLHHRLVDMGFNHKQTVRILYAVSALLSISSVMLITQKIVYAIIIIAVSLGISVVTWIIFKDKKMRIESGLMPEKPANAEKAVNSEASEKTDIVEISEISEEEQTDSLSKSKSKFGGKKRADDK